MEDCLEPDQCSTDQSERAVAMHVLSIELFHSTFVSCRRTTVLGNNAFFRICSSSLAREEGRFASLCLKIRQVVNNVLLVWHDHIDLSLLPPTAGHQFPPCRIFLTRNEAHRGTKDCALLEFACDRKEVKLPYFCPTASPPGSLSAFAALCVQQCGRPSITVESSAH